MQAVDVMGLALAKAQAYEEMERRIETRTAELTSANERMQVLSNIRDEFVANVSHELRTPITSIKLHHHLMMLRPENFETYMDRLIRETARLEHIVSDLLRLSELDRGKLDLSLNPTDIHEMVNYYIMDRTLLADDRGLMLSYEPSNNLPLVNIDLKLIGQSLSILLTNAMAYTPRGGEIVVRTTVQAKDGKDWVVLSVSDTGPGISPEDMSELFQRFFRGKSGRSSDAPGTGLGLAIAQEIVDRHHGRIEAVSEGIEGKGSTFSIWLPVLEATEGTNAG
jgi:signal transduction histidine kinase